MLRLMVISAICCYIVYGDRTKDKIYYDVTFDNGCYRRLNATHQTGCSSSRNGDVGVLHYIEQSEDMVWLMDHGPHNPYVVLLTQEMFTDWVVNELYHSGKINGILVIHNQTDLPDSFSPDDTCPNSNFELYKDDPEYGNCKKNTWNPHGNSLMLEDFDIQIIALKNWTRAFFLINECYEKFNKPINSSIPRSYPLCGAQVKFPMDAVRNSPSCIRRGKPRNFNPQTYCDPLGDENVYGFLKPIPYNNTQDFTPKLANKSVIVAAAKLDTTSLFETMYPGAEGTVVGFIALLAAAQALGKVKDTINQTDNPIMFTFFQGETYDYMGSTRMLYDMHDGNFPYRVGNGAEGPHPIRPEHVGAFLELSQVGQAEDNTLWVHSDPRSRKDTDLSTTVTEIEQMLAEHGLEVGMNIKEASFDLPLPPASLQTFLRNLSFPGVVLADYNEQYQNQYYNSRHDIAFNLNFTFSANATLNESQYEVTPLAQHLTNTATAVARTLYQLSTGRKSTELNADNETVAQLLYCFFITPRCDLFNLTMKEDEAKLLQKEPYDFYVGIDRQTNPVTQHTLHLLSYFTGNEQKLNESECKAAENPYYKYVWVQGPVNASDKHQARIGLCLETTANKSIAKSPAFVDGYDWSSNKYAGWTESIWPDQAPVVRVFLIPDRNYETMCLCVGLAVFIASFVIIFFCNRRSHLLFETRIRLSTEVDD